MENRERYIYKVTLVGSAANVILTVFKFVAGIVGHSAAMTADAVHSLSDLLTDAVVLLFVRISSKPEDRDHDEGGDGEQDMQYVLHRALYELDDARGYKRADCYSYADEGLGYPDVVAEAGKQRGDDGQIERQ